jgi:preprotein translocase subunit SecG
MKTVLLLVLFLDSLILMAAVLLQAGQGGGLASLGGGGGTEVFMGGRQAATILTRITWWCGSIFLALAFIITILSSRGGAPRSVIEGQVAPPAPVQTSPLPLPTNPAPPGPPAPPAAPPQSTRPPNN